MNTTTTNTHTHSTQIYDANKIKNVHKDMNNRKKRS